MTIYVSNTDYKCSTTPKDGYTPVETDFFDGKCETYIEGYCYKVEGNTTSIYPNRPISLLLEFQGQYERQQMVINEYESALAEIETALGV